LGNGKVEVRSSGGKIRGNEGKEGEEGVGWVGDRRGGRSGADRIPCSKTLDISGDEIFRMVVVGVGVKGRGGGEGQYM